MHWEGTEQSTPPLPHTPSEEPDFPLTHGVSAVSPGTHTGS